MMTSRFVNTKGRCGCNLPCDLHLEHLNRMESNIKPSTLEKATKSISIVEEICTSFSDEVSVSNQSDNHAKPSYLKDYKLVLNVLTQKEVFSIIPKRRHASISLSEFLLESAKYEAIVPSFV